VLLKKSEPIAQCEFFVPDFFLPGISDDHECLEAERPFTNPSQKSIPKVLLSPQKKRIAVKGRVKSVSYIFLYHLQEGHLVTVTHVTTEHYQGSVSLKGKSSMEVEVSIFKNIHVLD
jgi:hypothetical protein